MTKGEGKSDRRMGPAGSENWHAMLDGAEDILREEGYAALTSRRIAERIGVKQRLIYYYFRTMDDLVVDLFRRLSERELARLAKAAQSSAPLREIWNICMHTTDAKLISEFMALANRIDGLRKEVIFFIDESRTMQVAALEAAARNSAHALKLPARSVALIATSVALALTREEQLGTTCGHAETLTVIENLIAALEPAG